MYQQANVPTNQALAGYVQQGQTNYTGDAPQQPTRLSNIAAHQEGLNGEFGNLAERFDRLADRLCGSQPKEVPGSKDGFLRGGGAGLAAIIENHLEHGAALVNRLRVALERLETL